MSQREMITYRLRFRSCWAKLIWIQLHSLVFLERVVRFHCLIELVLEGSSPHEKHPNQTDVELPAQSHHIVRLWCWCFHQGSFRWITYRKEENEPSHEEERWCECVDDHHEHEWINVTEGTEYGTWNHLYEDCQLNRDCVRNTSIWKASKEVVHYSDDVDWHPIAKDDTNESWSETSPFLVGNVCEVLCNEDNSESTD